MFDELNEPVELSPIGKKRRILKENTKKEQEKRSRHSGEGKNPEIACSHDSSSFCKAALLTPEDLTYNYDLFYKKADKQYQDQLIIRLIDIGHVKRKRISDDKRQQPRNFATRYFVFKPKQQHKDSSRPSSSNSEDSTSTSVVTENDENRISSKVQVCKESFLHILGIGKGRCHRVIQYYAQNDSPRPERRGGWRKAQKYDKMKEDIREHIKTFSCRASHYGRRGAPGRKYLPSELNVSKMHSLFLEQNHSQVTYALYYSVFSYDFNLAFGHPATDVCSTCIKHRLHIKDPNLSDEEKKKETVLYLLHRRRSRVFYDLLNDTDDSVTVTFDMMENLVLPKTPVNMSYYSRQLYMYVFCVVIHHGKKSHQGKEDVFIYTWCEHENKKNSNMTASALTHVLLNQLFATLKSAKKLRLFSDSCFGQNKNFNVLSMLSALRKRYLPNLEVIYTFPVRGHSFLPADRVFGRIEQEIRREETIILPSEYYQILRNHGSVFIYQKDWHAYDFKSETTNFVKAQRPFRISDVKILEISAKGVGVKFTYNATAEYHFILKKGKCWSLFNPKKLSPVNTVKAEKKDDVMKLLNDIAAKPDVMSFYQSALTSETSTSQSDSDDDC